MLLAALQRRHLKHHGRPSRHVVPHDRDKLHHRYELHDGYGYELHDRDKLHNRDKLHHRYDHGSEQ